MICDECGVNDATIKLVTVVNGEKCERHLCADCMSKIKTRFAAADLSSIAGLISGLLQQASQKPGKPAEEPAIDLTCEKCGTTYEAFKKTGLLGCSACYDAFREPLLGVLKRVQGQTQHAGRVPGGQSGDVSLRMNIERLRHELGRAISEEEYEEAASLRDQIRALTARMEALKAEKEGEAHA